MAWLGLLVRAASAAEFPLPNLVIQTAASVNLVTNGDFETGTLSGWTLAGNTGFTGILAGGAASGTYQAYIGPVGSTGSLTQTLTTIAGTRYALNYQLRATGNTPNQLDVFWNGGAIASLNINNANAFGWTSFSALNLVASGPSTTLSFVYRHDPGYFYLDNVGVTVMTPEASTMALVGGALLLIGGYRRRTQVSCQRPSASDRRT
ncbi:MAG: hypothetical protein K2X03_25065 [Bryobacteraceae bacterium]|nr:hypothetical protein [Bryobacteraceae bacterium]